MKEKDIIREIPGQLERLLKMPVKPVSDHTSAADAVFKAGRFCFVVAVKCDARVLLVREACNQAQTAAERVGRGAIPLVVVSFMGPAGRSVCESSGVSFMDLSGNARVEARGLLIDIDGRPNRFLHRGRPSSIFAPKSSRVARLMLLDPGRWWRRIEIARHTRLDKGYVSRIVGRLDEAGLINNDDTGRIRPRDPDRMLTAWEEQYRFDRHIITRGHVPARSGVQLCRYLADMLGDEGVDHAFTGLAAAYRITPYAGFRLVTVYVERVPEQALLDRISFREGAKGANTWFIVPDDAGVFDGSRVVDHVRCVNTVQAYLDLRHMPERADEAAAHLRAGSMPWQ